MIQSSETFIFKLEGTVTHAVRDTLQSIAVAGCDKSQNHRRFLKKKHISKTVLYTHILNTYLFH